MKEHRFDVIYKGNDVSIDYHFCRGWDGDRGCYGTNPDHGLTFDDARREVANHYRGLTASWDEITYEQWAEPYGEPGAIADMAK